MMINKTKTLAIVTANRKSQGSMVLNQAALELNYHPIVCLADDDNTPSMIDNCDAVIYRRSPKTVAIYEKLYTTLKNERHKVALEHSLKAFDKCDSYIALDKASIKMPKSLIIRNITQPVFLPGVVKAAVGNKGIGVSLIFTKDEYYSLVNTLLAGEGKCLYQEYIEESKGTDKRIIVCGDKVITSMKRIAQPGEFRANIHLGASAVRYDATVEECSIAIASVKALSLPYAGVDIIDSKSGPLVLEVNPSPGFMIGTINGINIPRLIVEYLMNIDGETENG